MNGKITYHQQVSYCGKPRCRKCREGIGHGPYWYSYQTVNGHTTRTYIGKSLPQDVQASLTAASVVDAPTNLALALHTAFLRVSTLGQFRLERRVEQQWQLVADALWQQQRVRALFAFLLCHPGRKVSRSQVMVALWPKSSAETASNNLNKTLHHLRKVLGVQHEGFLQETPLRSEGEWLILAGQRHIWVDADAFEELAAQSDDARQREHVLREAVALYGGDFLPEGRQVEWVLGRRQVLRHTWLGLLLEWADVQIGQGAVPGAIDILDRLLANDPTNESAVQRLMVVLAQLKRRGEALRVYQRLASVLQREYKIAPSKETRELYEAVREGSGQVGRGAIGISAERNVSPGVSMKNTATEVRFPTRDIRTGRIGRSHQSPLVGRDFELEVLRALLFDVQQSTRVQLVGQRRLSGIPLDTQRQPQCMVLMGEAGIGKTRLAEEMSREAQRRDWEVIWCRAYTHESGVPYRIWTEALRKVLALQVGTGFASTRPVPHLDTLHVQPLTALLPELGEIAPRTQRSQPLHMMTPEQEQLRLWEAARELLAGVSETTPLLIVLDDIQWADGSSCELLGYLARHLYGYPVLLVATCRDTELPVRPPHPLRSLIAHMQREHSVKTLNIAPLSSEQIGMLVSSLSRLPEATIQHIQTHAAGNPFFAEELARITPPTLPKTVAAALDQRMDRLSSSCRQLLGNAAVLGGSFEFPVICAMEASLTDEDAVLNLLEEALQSGVLTEEGTGTRITYHFWHPLLVSHLYDRVSAARRARLHQRAADVIARMHQGREEEVAATIVLHLVRAGAEAEQIVHYAQIAADKAYALPAYSEAEQHYLLALKYVEQSTAGKEQRHLVYLLEHLAECSAVRGNFEEARHLYERVLELRTALSSQNHYQESIDEQHEAQIQALLWSEIGRVWSYTGDSALAQRCCEHSEQVLREANVIGGPAWARLRFQQGGLYWHEGHYQDAQRVTQEALTLFEQQQKSPPKQRTATSATHSTRIHRTLEGDPVDLGRTHALLGALANGVGKRTEALIHLGTALALYEQYDYKREIAHVSCNMGHVHLKKAEYKLAHAALRRALSLAERVGDTPLISVIYSNLGELAAVSGDLEEGEDWYKRGLALAERFNDRKYMSLWNAGLAAVLQEQGKLDEAVVCVVRAWSIGRAMHNNPCIGTALVTMSNLRIAQAVASTNLPKMRARLLRLARRDAQRALELEGIELDTRATAKLALAHLSLLSGEKEKAREEIARVLGEAQRYELAQVTARAKQLLR